MKGLVIIKPAPRTTYRHYRWAIAWRIDNQRGLAALADKLTMVVRMPLAELKDGLISRFVTLTAEPCIRVHGWCCVRVNRLYNIGKRTRSHLGKRVLFALHAPFDKTGNLFHGFGMFLLQQRIFAHQRGLLRLELKYQILSRNQIIGRFY